MGRCGSYRSDKNAQGQLVPDCTQCAHARKSALKIYTLIDDEAVIGVLAVPACVAFASIRLNKTDAIKA